MATTPSWPARCTVTRRAALRGLDGVNLRDGARGAGDGAVVFFDEGEGGGGLDVADDGDGGVVGPVVGVVELAEFFDGHVLDVAAPADRGVMVGMADVGGGVDFLFEGADGVVLADLEFVADDGHLGAAVGFAQPEVAHAVGLDGDVGLDVVFSEVGVVVGAVEPGGGVVEGADAFEELVDAVALLAVEVLGALEHEVLEEVGGAGGAGDLVARADAVGDHEGDNGRGVFGEDEHLEAVGVEGVFGDASEGFDGGEAFGGLGGRSVGREEGAGGENAEDGGQGTEETHGKGWCGCDRGRGESFRIKRSNRGYSGRRAGRYKKEGFLRVIRRAANDLPGEAAVGVGRDYERE